VDGVTVLVVDGDEQGRTQLLLALRRLGLRALGVVSAADAAALLDALDADVTVLRGEADELDLLPLKRKSRLVQLSAGAPLDEAVVELLRALGRPDAAALIN
jgi:hypothetical protein